MLIFKIESKYAGNFVKNISILKFPVNFATELDQTGSDVNIDFHGALTLSYYLI